MKRPRCVLVLLALRTSMGVQVHAQEWKVAKTGDGIEVSTRVVPGWGIKEFRAITRVHARLSSVVAVLEDVDAYPQWFADCREARTHLINIFGSVFCETGDAQGVSAGIAWQAVGN